MDDAPSQKPDDPPDDVRWRLQRCDGFLDLGMTDRARTELQALPAAWRDHPAARRLQLRLHLDRKEWADARDTARALRDAEPTAPEAWVMLAFATRRATGLGDAEAVLNEAARRFPSVPVIRFNLACYACQDGRLDDARRFLHQAFLLDRSFRDTAIEDEDLRPLWDEVEEGRF